MKPRNLVIDLTALLDVILIILFMVLVSSAVKADDTNKGLMEENAKLQQQVDSLEYQKMPIGETERRWYSVYNKEIGKVELRFPADPSKEPFKLVFSAEREIIKPQSEDFASWIEKSITMLPEEVVIVTFSYRNDAIYWKDYTETRDLLIALSNRTGKKIIYEEIPQE